MCNIAGYAGTNPAAPILLEMLKNQEGLDSGFFTGISTIHEGKIYYAKVVGDINTLLERTDALSLPGTIGIAHSRTPGGAGEGDSWAHPFTTERSGSVLFAQVLNGWAGRWTPQVSEYLALGKQLVSEGYPLKSSIHAPGRAWSIDGDISVHTSDIFTQLTAKKIDDGQDAVSALLHTYEQMPEEIASLALSVTEPDAIVWGRMNFPMFRSTTKDGTYLATSPTALPSEAGSHELLPAASAGIIRKDSFTCHSFNKDLQELVPPLTPQTVRTAYDVICQALRAKRHIVNDLFQILYDKSDPSLCHQFMPLIYETILDLQQHGRLVIEKEYDRGMTDDLKAPTQYLRLKESARSF